MSGDFHKCLIFHTGLFLCVGVHRFFQNLVGGFHALNAKILLVFLDQDAGVLAISENIIIIGIL